MPKYSRRLFKIPHCVVITIVKPKKKDQNHRVQCILKTVIYNKLYRFQ